MDDSWANGLLAITSRTFYINIIIFPNYHIFNIKIIKKIKNVLR